MSNTVKGFPFYELEWKDGELFPGTWTRDDNCHGLPGQKYQEPFMVRLLNKLDRDADRREAAQQVLEFAPDTLALTERNQMQLEAAVEKRAHERHGPRIEWSEDVPDAPFREFPPREQVYRPKAWEPRHHTPGRVKCES